MDVMVSKGPLGKSGWLFLLTSQGEIILNKIIIYVNLLQIIINVV